MITIANKTDYPTREVNRLVRRALEYLEVERGVTVTVSHTTKRQRGWATGRYRNYWYPARGERGPQITIRLPHPDAEIKDYIPYRRANGGQRFKLEDWREALIALVAHEGQHHKQTSRRRGGRGFIEVECDLAAFRAVQYYREDSRKTKGANGPPRGQSHHQGETPEGVHPADVTASDRTGVGRTTLPCLNKQQEVRT